MSTLSRRQVLMLAGAAGAAPFVTSPALGRQTVITATKICDLDVIDSMNALWVWVMVSGTLTRVQAAGNTFSVDYKATDGGPFVFYPFAMHVGFTCPQKEGTNSLTKHKFTVEGVRTGNGILERVRITCEAYYGVKKPAATPSCCFMCGSQEVCIPKGHSVLCGGVEVTC